MDPVLRRGGIEQKIKEAARLARIAPEKYRGTAFPILLRHLMGAGGHPGDWDARGPGETRLTWIHRIGYSHKHWICGTL